jgi:hypothetical protein
VEYERLIAEWRTTQQTMQRTRAEIVATADPSITISEVILRYRDFAKGYYVKNGEQTHEFLEMGYALRPVRQMFGRTLAREFGPLKLKVVRQAMIDSELCRGVINQRSIWIKRTFKWAVAEELVPPSVYEGLRAVPGLKKGRTTAKEAPRVKPVEDDYVDAVLPHVSPQVAAMIQLQRLTDMRPCEVVAVHAEDIDRTGDVWIYSPSEHKNAWRGHDRQIPLGPKAQEILSPFLSDSKSGFVFSPREAEQHRSNVQRAARKTRVQPSQQKRKPKKNPKRPKRDHYDTASYRRAITYGINKENRLRKKAGEPEIPHWFSVPKQHQGPSMLFDGPWKR